MKKVSTNTKLIESQRQSKNIMQLLTRAKFTTSDCDTETGSTKWEDPRCGTCLYMLKTKTVDIRATEENFTI